MGAMMGLSFSSLIGALVFLGAGVLEFALARRSLYPVLRMRHERAKLTQTQGMEPNRIMTLIKVQSLLIMPVAGFLLGSRLKGMLG
jgi:hypothetical protein